MGADEHHSLGVFKPVGHVVVSFPSADQAGAARKALADAGLGGQGALRYYTDREMLEQIDHDLAHASPVAGVGQELNLVKAHRVLAERGYHWLVVPASRDALAQQVADICREHGAERAQSYGRFIIEELIVRDSDEQQFAESPDRGLDAGTPSGTEAERTRMRPGGDEPGR
ncbi:MAG TPA: hypothetical protein VFR90_08270 [Methylibium sp.]|uniref:hypothetical protein n=1 Tax=Methylibium sp. TaxID=2067992 RepID=UPI002DBC0511|nr:hypothetical protein [Methylibium sp.]HEU4459100.1 hypothetical protein [Methylibium sp.]